MDTRDAYNSWARSYDDVANKTRDLEAFAIREVLKNISVKRILELGCGTGKNTSWLVQLGEELTGVDFSEAMLDQARQKLADKPVYFLQRDLTKTWDFGSFDLISCSLVVEHIGDLNFIFSQASLCLNRNGLFYLCELHPYKQIQGSRAKFEMEGNIHHLEYFVHHISDYFNVADRNGFLCTRLDEWFDDEQKEMPRLVSFLFRKK